MTGDKLSQVKAAGAAVLDLFAPDDEVGLWSFSNEIRRLNAIDLVGAHRAELARSIDRLDANGGTALYRVTAEAVRDVRSTWNPTRINAVVLLTDGQNSDGSNSDLDGLLHSLAAQPASSSVPVFTIGYGQDADLQTLKRIAEASGGRSYNAPVPSRVGTVFADVISNF